MSVTVFGSLIGVWNSDAMKMLRREFLERTFAESPFTTEFFAQRGAYLQATDQLLGTNWRNILPEAASFHDEFYPFTKRLPSDRDELNLSST